MPRDLPAEVRRARPLLGTLVEIAVRGVQDPDAAIEAAFGAVAGVHAAMSYHDPTSDVSRLNARAHRRPVAVLATTFEVLQSALAWSERTDGAFDVSIAPQLERQGLLPRRRLGTASGSWRDIECLPGRRIRFRRPMRIDLGGIAKGYAVDRACAALRARGVGCALVNAGGDLRVVGSTGWPIALRHPAEPGHRVPLCELADGAIATSAAYFLPETASRRARALVDGRTRTLREWHGSVSVSAATCMAADALTKVVGLMGARAERLLTRERATACIIGIDGTTRILGAQGA
ncbi:MAG: FAD:protein FMN transferase [Beijerinckiaceae bacterium]|nr:FAD:protein FMN transferase [Beijerinckiaceae bacterium]